MNQSGFEIIKCNLRKARENAQVQLAAGFGFAIHRLRKWRDFCQPITKQSTAKPKQTQLTRETHLKSPIDISYYIERNIINQLKRAHSRRYDLHVTTVLESTWIHTSLSSTNKWRIYYKGEAHV